MENFDNNQPTEEQKIQTEESKPFFCSNCGARLNPDATFCHSCGQRCDGVLPKPISSQSVNGFSPDFYINSNSPLPLPGQTVSRKEFINLYARPEHKKNIKTVAIFCYVLVAINAVIAVLSNPLAMIDSLVLLAFALGMHIAKSKGCAIGIFVLGIVEIIMGLYYGTFPYMWLLAGILALTTFVKIDKDFKQFKKYLQDGMLTNDSQSFN